MNKQLYLVYEGDAKLMKDSLVLMGVYEEFGKAVEDTLEAMSDGLLFDDSHTDSDARKQLEETCQTQGFDANYLIRSVELNKWEEVNP